MVTKCAPQPFPEYRSWQGTYWRKEVHISVPLRTVLKELLEKHKRTLIEEETF